MNTATPTGLRVAVTGGGRGIGAATAHAFARCGATVAIGDIDGEVATETARSLGDRVRPYELDVSSYESFSGFLDDVENDIGPVDVMVNNAGIMSVVAFADESVASIERQLSVNIAGVIYGSQLAVRRMMTSGRGGHVVNVASVAGKLGLPGVATYCASKHAVVGLTEALALEYQRSGIAFSCVIPGAVNTELAAGIPDHRLLPTAEPEHVAAAIVEAVTGRPGDVYVPARLKAMITVSGQMPKRMARAAMSRFGVHSYMTGGAASGARAGYDARIATPRRPAE